MNNIMDNSDTTATLKHALLKILKALVRLVLRFGLSYEQFEELCKQAFVEVAEDAEFMLPGRKQTDSRVSVVTGLSRREVKRLRELDRGTENLVTPAQYNRAARVLNNWLRDQQYQDQNGAAAVLAVEGEDISFTNLVKSCGGDIPMRAVLDELVRVGAVVRLDDGRVRIVRPSYTPVGNINDILNILGADVTTLVETITHNLSCTPDDTYLQLKVSYNNLPDEAVPRLRKIAAEDSHLFLRQLDRWFALEDRDASPRPVTGEGQNYAGVGIYFFSRQVKP